MPGGVLVPARIRGSVGSMHYLPSTLVPTPAPSYYYSASVLGSQRPTGPVRSHVQLLQRFSTCYRNQEHRTYPLSGRR